MKPSASISQRSKTGGGRATRGTVAAREASRPTRSAAASTAAAVAAAPAIAAASSPSIASESASDVLLDLSGDPAQEVEAILVSSAGLEGLLAVLPDEVTVSHTYRLIGSVAVKASLAALRGLSRLPAIARIESVRPVAACKPVAH